MYAYFEWAVTNENSIPQDDGDYMCIYGAWVNEAYRNSGALEALVKKLFKETIDLEYQYVIYNRSKYNGRKSKVFPVYKFLKHVKLSEVI